MIWPAFFIGLLGSLHCLGMCGPIALALPIPKEKNRFVGILLYNSGRIVTYGMFGFLFGSFGSLFVMAGLQQFLSIFAGTSILIMVLMTIVGNSKIVTIPALTKSIVSIKNILGHYLNRKSFYSLFIIGLLNGLLPCGLVYMAIIGAIATGNSFDGTYYMMLFGLGTVPMMFLLVITKSLFPSSWRFKLIKTLPFAIGLLGIILVVRGLNLNIPYISPGISSKNPMTSTCCKK
jgi:sulfite exporter TauE/SafE